MAKTVELLLDPAYGSGILDFHELRPDLETRLRETMNSIPVPQGSTSHDESQLTERRARAMTDVVLDEFYDPNDGI